MITTRQNEKEKKRKKSHNGGDFDICWVPVYEYHCMSCRPRSMESSRYDGMKEAETRMVLKGKTI